MRILTAGQKNTGAHPCGLLIACNPEKPWEFVEYSSDPHPKLNLTSIRLINKFAESASLISRDTIGKSVTDLLKYFAS